MLIGKKNIYYLGSNNRASSFPTMQSVDTIKIMKLSKDIILSTENSANNNNISVPSLVTSK